MNVQTHIKGRTLDLLLTSNRNMLKDIKVLDVTNSCKSDHLPITCKIITNIKYIETSKRKILNFNGVVVRIPAVHAGGPGFDSHIHQS